MYNVRILYTQDVQIKQKKEKPIRKTLLLDQTTIDILEEYGLFKSGDTTISNAIRVMARDYKERQWKK